MSKPKRTIVVGGGAAGFFSALSAKEFHPEEEVLILEKTNKLLSKVKVSGGGRCNVTNHCFELQELLKGYPRGSRFLKKVFRTFAVQDTIDWFEKREVTLIPESDNRMFPDTHNSQTIINCFLEEARRLGVEIKTKMPVEALQKLETGFQLSTPEGEIFADKVILATGGIPKYENMRWLEELGCKMIPPVPSLFTFNMPKNPVTALMGISVENVKCKIEGEKLQTEGPLLITHWGMSGPAVLKLSAWGARILADKKYQFNLLVNWLPELSEEEIRTILHSTSSNAFATKKMMAYNPFDLPKRLWQFFLQKIEISEETQWNGIGKKNLNRLVDNLMHDVYPVTGKTTFKEEFVTAGGVDLAQINPQTMEHKTIPGLFFTGEILDIDGITGGYNFQAAWTTGYVAGRF